MTRKIRPVWGMLGPASVSDDAAAAETHDGRALPPDVLRKHLRHLQLRGLADGTIYARRRAIARMCTQVSAPLLEATEDDLMAWRETLAFTPGTIAEYVSHAREFYAWSIEAGHRADNPAARLPVPVTGRRIPRPIGEEEIMAAVAAASRRIRPWLVLAGWAGLRAKEIALLRRENVLNNARPPAIIIASDATKGHRERIVPMSAFVLEELTRAGLSDDGYLFRRRDFKSGPNSPQIVSQLANEHLHNCGINATLHQLRHRFGTQAYQESGHDLRLVQELLGHATPATTAGYAAYSRENADRTVSALAVPARVASPCPA